MLYLVLHLICALVFVQVLRFAQLNQAKMVWVAAINYVIAAIFSVVLYLSVPHASASLKAILLGVGNGTLFFLTFFALIAAYQIAGTGITVALINSSVVMPVVFAYLVWPHLETMTSWRWVAVLLIPLAMYLMRPGEEQRRLTFKADVILLLLFVMSGLINVNHKWVMAIDPSSHHAYQMSLFLAAAIGSGLWALYQGNRPSRRDWSAGIIVGLSNGLGLVMALIALGVMEAVVYFTTVGSLTIVLTLLSSWLLWREKVTPRQAVGIAAAIAIVVLTHLPE